jgi:hypothetical protein
MAPCSPLPLLARAIEKARRWVAEEGIEGDVRAPRRRTARAAAAALPQPLPHGRRRCFRTIAPSNCRLRLLPCPTEKRVGREEVKKRTLTGRRLAPVRLLLLAPGAASCLRAPAPPPAAHSTPAPPLDARAAARRTAPAPPHDALAIAAPANGRCLAYVPAPFTAASPRRPARRPHAARTVPARAPRCLVDGRPPRSTPTPPARPMVRRMTGRRRLLAWERGIGGGGG